MMQADGDHLPLYMHGEALTLPLSLVQKYATSGPRYTSYPTAPEWREVGADAYVARLAARAAAKRPLSLYTHIPFCAERCHYCGCNVVITKQTAQAEKYLGYLLRELEFLAAALPGDRTVMQYHWGGGTPTYFDESQIQRWFDATANVFTIAADAEIAIESDPRVTSVGQLQRLRRLGFNRISFGVQSFDPVVQATVNRVQPYEMVRDFTAACRDVGFGAVNFDLIYGLPDQSLAGFLHTLDLTLQLRPDRIALYNYAHIPAILKHQRRMDGALLPAPLDKVRMFTQAIERFTKNGYRFIGLDHFALERDELAVAARGGSLQRNFMGHTTKAGADLLALRVSGISMFDDAYFQNEKVLIDYYRALDAGRLPVHRGIPLNADDRLRRDVINHLLCNGVIPKPALAAQYGIDFDTHFADQRAALAGFVADGVLREDKDSIRATPLGRLFLRNVAMLFDAYLQRPGGKRTFSKTV